MSGVMEEAMRMEALGLNIVPEKNVCSNHFDENSMWKIQYLACLFGRWSSWS